MQAAKHNWRVDLGDGYWYDNTPDYHNLDFIKLEQIEKKNNCKFVTEWPTKTQDGKATATPKLIFWSETAHPEGSNWMGLYEHEPYWYVCDGISASELPIECVVSKDKQVLFSKYRHDYRGSNDQSVAIDGGREYTRIIGNVRCERVWLVPYLGKLKIIPETMAVLILEKK